VEDLLEAAVCHPVLLIIIRVVCAPGSVVLGLVVTPPLLATPGIRTKALIRVKLIGHKQLLAVRTPSNALRKTL